MTEPPASSASLPSRALLPWIIGSFFLLTFLVYGSSLTNAFVRWDDGLLIYENPAIRSITPQSLKTIFTSYDPELYIPLTFFSYQLDFLLGGTNATIYHIQNLFWHTLNALLVAWLLLKLTRRGWLALFGGLLFALHPLHTEAVAWASARKDVLSTFFFLLSVIAYLQYRSDRRHSTYFGSLAAFLLGMLAKVTAITLPVILILIDIRERRRWDRTMLMEKLPFFALSIVFGIIAFVGKTGVLASSSLSEKLLMAPKSAVFYMEKLFVPVGLSVLYPFTGSVILSRLDILIPFLLFVVLIVIALISLKWTREIFFGVAFFLITVSPTLLNFAKGDSFYFASDRYAYVPSIGIFFLIVLAFERFCHERTKPCVIAASFLLAALGVLSTLQAKTWRNSETLFTQALKISPDAYVARVNLGNVQRYRGDEEQAITSYNSALATMRKFGRTGAGLNRAESKTLSNLASAQREQSDLTAAQSTYQEALRKNPQNVYALLGLGVIAGQQGNNVEAERLYRLAIMTAPDFAPAQLNLGALLVGLNRLEEGVTAYRAALDLNPFFPQAHYNLGVALMKLNRPEEAEAAYREAIRLQPKYTAARINLGILLFNIMKDPEGAQAQFEAILAYDPSNTQARSALQQILGTH
ncbi:MAG: tetratricopeptide repeat protein [Candidatus Peribacteraceae bacterium]|nr:tetratricopeptide repeat protein [Candidatus Peribacteraceae bacterium]MDD5742665.1 tetratricopeptide repeat protein [Candidatus Peribacteraceae bacterium]